jgi:hypothetical protein
MTLIKSKINSLAWLKSAIYVSVVGGGILSSFTPVLAATLSARYDNPTSVFFTVNQSAFGNGVSTLYYSGRHWNSTITIDEYNGPVGDSLVVRVYLQHIRTPHEGDGRGGQLNLNFRAESFWVDRPIWDNDISRHPGGHFDLAEGVLTANTFDYGGITGIRNWELRVSADHNVPEPTTMLGTFVALGWGAWLKRKSSIK